MNRPRKSSLKMEEYDPNETKTTKKATPPPVQAATPQEAIIQQAKENEANEPGFFAIDGLPTDGQFYPEGTEIRARTMKVTEVKMLSNMDETNANDLINDILRRTVRGIEIEDLFTADKLYIIFWLRANTYKDSGYEVTFDCPLCKKKSATYNFELDVLKIQKYSDEQYKKFTSEITLSSGNKITLKLLTVQDENDNQKFLKQNENSMMDFDTEIISLCRMIASINGDKKMGMLEKYRFVTEELNPQDYAYIESFVQDCGIGIEPSVDVKCNACGGSTESVLPFRPDFFLPKIRT